MKIKMITSGREESITFRSSFLDAGAKVLRQDCPSFQAVELDVPQQCMAAQDLDEFIAFLHCVRTQVK